MKSLKNILCVLLCSLFFISCGKTGKISNKEDLNKLSKTLTETLKKESIKTDYSKESIKQLEDWLSKQKKKKQKELINQVGAYLGESIIKNYGGSWVKTNGNWSVELSENNMIFPISKVYKFVHDGPEDSFYTLFKLIPVVFKK